LPVVRRIDEVPYRRRRDSLLAKVLYVRNVADALRHLRTVRQQELPVAPHARERLTRRRFRLGDLILVMREDQIHAAAMHIERLTELFPGHRGAFEVPS